MSEYRKVYQSGHTDTWCNGETHVRTPGGFVHPSNETMPSHPRNSEPYECDCAFWRMEAVA